MKLTLFQGILLGVFGLAAVIGLFVFATYSGGGGSHTIGTVVVWGTLPDTDVQASLTELSAQIQDLKGVSYVEKKSGTLATDLAAAIATGSSPDLILASDEDLHSLTKFISPIPSGTLTPADYQKAFVREGNLFTVPQVGYAAVPVLVDPLVLYANRTILSSSGIASPPSTWEALIGLVPKVAVLSASRQITRACVALGTYDNIDHARGILSTLFLQSGVPLSQVQSTGIIAGDLGSRSDTGQPPGQAVVSFYTLFADPSKLSYTWNASLPSSEQLFLTGDLALYFGYASEARYLRAANPNLDFIVSPVPQPATASQKQVYAHLYGLMISRGAKNPAGALTVALLMSNPQEDASLATHTGLAPAALSLLSSAPSDPVAAVAASEALYASGWLSPSGEGTDQIFSSMITGVITGRLSVAAALTFAEQSLTAALQQ